MIEVSRGFLMGVVVGVEDAESVVVVIVVITTGLKYLENLNLATVGHVSRKCHALIRL